MRLMTKLMAGSVGFAAIAAAAPAAAQYYPYGYSNGYSNPYAYSNPYTPAYGAYGQSTSVATNQCTAAVQSRLYNRTSLGSILGSLIGLPTNSYGRVVSITQAYPRSGGGFTIRGLASSGRMASNVYGPYGVGAYGSLGYGYANTADLSFKCNVDYRGYVRDVDINRRY
jgi:hypothetical protein